MTKDNSDKYVVTAGYVTVETQVGAGRAMVDIPKGSPLPDDVSEEHRTRLIGAGAVAAESGDQEDRSDAAAARPVPGLVEPDEIDTDVIPAGSAEQVLEWVGEDLARARVALHEEKAKGLNARQGLITELEKVAGGLETDPPSVPESLVDDGLAVAPAAMGGVTVPSNDPGEGGGQPEQKPATRSRRAANKGN